jgi:hypothetical protein
VVEERDETRLLVKSLSVCRLVRFFAYDFTDFQVDLLV